MAVVLYDLAFEADRRPSPYCWRTRMALAHKGLACETRPVGFAEIKAIAGGGQRTVPVIEDNGRVLADSQVIADYLEEQYPSRPTLYGGAPGRALAVFVHNWVMSVQGQIFPMICHDLWRHVLPADRAYIRESREKRLGRPLEAAQAEREGKLEPFRRALEPLRATVKGQPYLCGERPMYADYIVFGTFQWARSASSFRLLADDDPVRDWFVRMLDLFDGLGRRSPGYD